MESINPIVGTGIKISKDSYKYAYYHEKSGRLVIKLRPAKQYPPSALDITEVWQDKAVVVMLYPHLRDAIDAWSEFETIGYTTAYRLSQELLIEKFSESIGNYVAAY